MSATFWRHIHGGSTHFPIVLLLASVVLDFVAGRSRDDGLRRGLHAAGFGSAVMGLLGALGAALAGLIITRGRILGGGYERIHHLFVWPAVISSLLFVGWRLFNSRPWDRWRLADSRFSKRGLAIYFAGMSISAALMVGAGYSGGEILWERWRLAGLAAEKEDAVSSSENPISMSAQTTLLDAGRQLFLKNCAHCHGADARGDEGPDLHNLDWTVEQIAARIRNGKKGQMTAFAGKLSPDDISNVIAYLRTLK